MTKGNYSIINIYLAINYGTEGWKLELFPTVEAAVSKAMEGTYGHWKILAELSLAAVEELPS